MPTTSTFPDWLVPPPAADADLRIWQDWKHRILTSSRDVLVLRNPWFTFRKEQIFERLGHIVPVVPLLYFTGRDGPCRFSDLVQRLDLPALGHRLVLKTSAGHSNQNVKVLDLGKWPRRARCLLHREAHTPAALEAWIDGRPFLVEPAMRSPGERICADFKVYMHRGEARMVLMVDRNKQLTTLAYIDCRSWLQIPLAEVFPGAPPEHYQDRGRLDDMAIVRAKSAAALAPRVASALDADDLFLSVDTYVSADAPEQAWLGEVTPRPGGLDGNWLRRRFLEYLFLDGGASPR